MIRWIWPAGFAISAILPICALRAQEAAATGPFTFGKFSVPGAVILSVESINNAGAISGYYMDSSGNYKGFVRPSPNVLTILSDPADKQSKTFTQAYQINVQSVVTGEFFDSSSATYSGFFYNPASETYKTYNVPDQPSGTITAVTGINSTGSEFCGYVMPPPYTTSKAFISVNGQVTVYAVNNAGWTQCTQMTYDGVTVGYYNDSSGVSHGFIRSQKGVITVVDYPGASTAARALPCGGLAGGTVLSGVSDRQDTAGHYWDSSNNEHAFSRTPGGIFQRIDYPGAFQTGGGATNNYGTVVGQYLDSSCAPTAFVAHRSAGGH